jgi:hypothetical protein
MNISKATTLDPQLRELLVKQGLEWKPTLVSIDTIDSTFDENWSYETFTAAAGNPPRILRVMIGRGEWKIASPAFRYYVQVA